MGIFNAGKNKKKETEFVKDPVAFIRFLREEDEELVEFGQTALIAAGTEVIDPLIALLINEEEDPEVRRRAGTVLSKKGTPAIAPLLDALKKQNLRSKPASENIGMIAAALGGMGSQAIEPLIRALVSEFRHVRFGAAIALVQTGEASAIDAVQNAALHGDPDDTKMFYMVLGGE
jgi:HEAT repeat protein